MWYKFVFCGITTVIIYDAYYYRTTTDGYDTDKMGPEFCMQFVPSQLTLTVGQSIVFQFQDKKKLMLLVKEVEGLFSFPIC